MQKLPRVSVIIPTLNEEKHIGHLLEDLSKQTYPLHEIIVVDGDSRDRTGEKVKSFKRVQLISLASAQVGKQRTTGGKNATGDILLFLDADVRLGPDTIERLIEQMERYHLDGACPIYWPITTNVFIILIYGFFNILFYLFQKIKPGGAGSCIVVRKHMFEKVGGFVDDNTYDDIIFIRKVAAAGDFGMILQKVSVSSRRFEKYGIFRMFLIYLLLAAICAVDAYGLANKVRYEFGRYDQ